MRSPGGALAAALLLAASAFAVIAAGPPAATLLPAAAGTEPHTWKNVRIDGGGFVPGIVNGALPSGASTTFGFLGSTTGTTDPVPAPTCSTP